MDRDVFNDLKRIVIEVLIESTLKIKSSLADDCTDSPALAVQLPHYLSHLSLQHIPIRYNMPSEGPICGEHDKIVGAVPYVDWQSGLANWYTCLTLLGDLQQRQPLLNKLSVQQANSLLATMQRYIETRCSSARNSTASY
jgi:hypothetical protein